MDDLFNNLSKATRHGPNGPEDHARQLIESGTAWDQGLVTIKRVWFLTQDEAEEMWDKAAAAMRYNSAVR